MVRSSLATARLQIAAAFLEPALRFSRLAGLSLDELLELTTEGYFRELQRQGMSWTAIARRMSKSRSTVASLAKRAAAKTPPLEGSERFAMQREIVLMLADGKPRHPDDIFAALPSFRSQDLAAVIDILLEEELLERQAEQVRISGAMLDILGEGFEQRLGSLRHVLDVVAQAVFARFYATSPPPKAFARVLTFLARPEEGHRLGSVAYENLEAAVIAEDDIASALTSEEQTTVESSVVMVFSEKPSSSTW